MNEDPKAKLLNIAEALADGSPVDWAGLREENPSLAEEVDRLRLLAEVAAAYRELRASQDPPAEGQEE